MGWYAIQRVDDAIDLTRDRLWPIERGTWLRFALIMFFVGGGGVGVPTFGQSFSGGDPGSSDPSVGLGAIPEWVIVAVVALVILGIALALALGVIGALMEFVFVESLRSDRVEIRASGRQFGPKGLRLFGFRLAIGLIVVAVFVLPIVLLAAVFYGGGAVAFASLLVIFTLLSPFAFVFAFVVGVIDGFTTHFVVPIMILEDRGVLSAWKRFWGPLKREWKQLVVYLVVMFAISVAVGLLGGIAGFAVAIVLAVPLAVFVVPIGMMVIAVGSGPLQIAGLVAIVVLVALYVIALVVTGLLINTPLETYRRYFALLVLGDIDDEFDIIPDRRPAIEG
ncbi:DUF7544 domain-containing protein [Halococcoides cellulosivorans]|uniref:Uncharacterized protein n=1 Tax=Halococcoides cellulosivorans TaxID=1679096 RepID=A0A2R4X0R7_9EURY|nr:hypothetical protein [Halococcoides cellulosivorans]AWB27389.1 hypothetical protein HARCEL1_06575 [Halococcoides cellulosivorans]